MGSRPPSPARTSSPPHFTGVEAHFTDDLDQSHWSWSTAAIAPLHTATRPRCWYNSKPMRRLAIGITKGGSGKTATACHLAHGLARDGHRVLLVEELLAPVSMELQSVHSLLACEARGL